ncbi:lamina-associated polypeptide 2 [Galendromus occidentalis]|uniref:Lamina-associated polypeptide 2 n=1 Tax=Galendromus occidentalis TaxID=34638 RepID=A0AAJ6W0G2_9ACAR|nr:lamina-associated polypeptide 2 [Galendromus occidentalis]
MGFGLNLSLMASSRMTKDQLRDALIEVGVKTPVKAKKADLVKLYREHVLNEKIEEVTANDSLIGGFSSDEEESVLLDTSHINRETDLKNLTNDELFYKLKELGETVGPILDSTRSIYEKRLSRVLNDDDAKDISAFSADEGDDEKEKETDTTDEYESHNEHFKGAGYDEKILSDGGNLKTLNTFQEKVEENNGTVTRIRKAHSVKTYTSETVNGKSFVPPPPKKRNYALIGGSIVFIAVIIAVILVWLKFGDVVPKFQDAVVGKDSAQPVRT